MGSSISHHIFLNPRGARNATLPQAVDYSYPRRQPPVPGCRNGAMRLDGVAGYCSHGTGNNCRNKRTAASIDAGATPVSVTTTLYGSGFVSWR